MSILEKFRKSLFVGTVPLFLPIYSNSNPCCLQSWWRTSELSVSYFVAQLCTCSLAISFSYTLLMLLAIFKFYSCRFNWTRIYAASLRIILSVIFAENLFCVIHHNSPKYHIKKKKNDISGQKKSWGWASEQKKDFLGQKLWKKLSLTMSKICQKLQKLSKISQTMVQKRAKNFSKWAQNNYLQPILSQFFAKIKSYSQGN